MKEARCVWYRKQIKRDRVDSIQLAVDWFQLPDSVPAVLQKQIVLS
jgi:hypothetical protein